jgi:hypothetical protein
MKKGRGHDKSGRSKRGPPFTSLGHWIQDSAAWMALRPDDVRILLGIWRRHTGANNGKIGFGTRDGKQFQMSEAATRRSLDRLMEKGFIRCRQAGSFDQKRLVREWEITAEPCDNRGAAKNFMKWSPSSGAAHSVTGDAMDAKPSVTPDANSAPPDAMDQNSAPILPLQRPPRRYRSESTTPHSVSPDAHIDITIGDRDLTQLNVKGQPR